MTIREQSGFTAVELLITLFVAVAFLVAGYQLYNVIIKDGGQTRGESRASNVAYDYLRRYVASSTANPCVASTPLTNSPITVAGISSVAVTVVVSCPYANNTSVSKVEATVNYNNPQQTVKYSTYTTGTGYTGTTTAPIGLLGWWKFNGNANDSSGKGNNASVVSATLTTGQNGQSNGAYLFNGSTSQLTIGSVFGLGMSNFTLSSWFNNPTATNKGSFIKIGNTNGYGLGIGSTTSYDTAGTRLVMLYEGVRWIITPMDISMGWHHIAMVVDTTGAPKAYLDGSFVGSYGGSSALVPTATTYIGGHNGTRFFTGSIDDVRVYNRALTDSEIGNIYAEGAQ